MSEHSQPGSPALKNRTKTAKYKGKQTKKPTEKRTKQKTRQPLPANSLV
jgi:hypothetical protein